MRRDKVMRAEATNGGERGLEFLDMLFQSEDLPFQLLNLRRESAVVVLGESDGTSSESETVLLISKGAVGLRGVGPGPRSAESEGGETAKRRVRRMRGGDYARAKACP